MTILDALAIPLSGVRWVFEGELPLVILKTLFLLLPLIFLTIASWLTCFSLPTAVFRQNKTQFVGTLLVAWWDGGRAILTYWGGIFKFAFLSVGWTYGALKIIVMGTYQTIKDIVFSPITIMTEMAKGYSAPGVPWIAVAVTFVWMLMEACIFTFVLTPLVSEVLYGITNMELPIVILSSGLFVFLFLIVGGSLACMHGLVEAIEEKKPAVIFKMAMIELIVMSMEVVFFYREFVEAILPFFNRMSEGNFEIGPVMILAIGAFAWLGVRSSIWFFFGKYGTPTLLAIIAREGVETSEPGKNIRPVQRPLFWIKDLTSQLQSEINWFSEKGEEILEAAMLPPIQVLAVCTNFAMLILTGRHLFNLPLRSIQDIKDTKELIAEITKEKRKS